MGGYVKSIALLAVVALLALMAVGCGSDSSSASDGGTTKEQGSSTAKGQSGSSAPSKGFGANNEAVRFGRESSAAELAVVSKLVEDSLEARAAKDWAGQCATLSLSVKQSIEFGSPAAEKQNGCATGLAAEGKGVSKKALRNNMAGPVVAFRVEGNEGYALYHGDDGTDWAMPMTKEGGEWKVNGLFANELPR
jgi:hypothetical protein